jgi:hypothetical protein
MLAPVVSGNFCRAIGHWSAGIAEHSLITGRIDRLFDVAAGQFFQR